MRGVLLLSVAAAVFLNGGRVCAQPTVRVRAETRIELSVGHQEGRVTVGATLRDDLGEALPDRRLDVRITGEDGAVEHASASTATGGRAEVQFDRAPGTYRVVVRYEGDESHQQVEVEQTLDLLRAHVRLTVAVGDRGRLDLDVAQHIVEVHAISDQGGAGLPIWIENELGRRLAGGRTNASGTIEFVLQSASLGPPAAGRLVVITSGDARRSSAQTEVPIVRFRPSHLSLSASSAHVEHDEPLELEGALLDSEGPLPRRAVGLFAGEEHLATVLTDDRGRFARTMELDAEGPVEVTARYASDAPWRTSATSAPLRIDVAGRGSTPWQWLLVSMLVSALLVAAFSRRPRARRDRDRRSSLPAPPGIAAARPLGRAAQHRDLKGRVLEADEDRPLVGATIVLRAGDGSAREIQTDEDGRFAIVTLEDGTFVLAVSAAGHERSEASMRVPHRGQWSDTTVRLRSLRQVALVHYRPVAEALAPARKWWAFWTPRELLRRAERNARSELEILTGAVERAAYAEEPPEEANVAEIGERSERLARELGER